MRRLLAVILFLGSALQLHSQTVHTSEIRMLRNERWWGLYVGGTMPQPFTGEFSVSTDSCGQGFFMTSMMVSDDGRYLWSPYPMKVSSDGKTFRITSAHERVEARRGGHTLREAYLVCYHNNIRANGNRLPEELFTEPVYDISLEEGWAPGSETILKYADEILAAGFPAGTLLLPRGWESLTRIADFNFDLHPSPGETIRRLHDKGFRIMLTLTPYVSAAGRNYAEALRDGRLLTDADGKPYFTFGREGYSACLDFSSETTAADFTARAMEMKERYGVDGFLLDCREALAFIKDDCDRLDAFIANWNKAGRSFDMKIYSSAFQLPAAASANDVSAGGELSWDNLANTINNVVVSGLSGYIYPYCNFGYIGNNTDEELLLRAIQLAVMMPVAVLPPSAWRMENAAYREQVRKLVQFRRDMGGYMAELFHGSESTAEPLARHMAYQFVNQGFWNCPDQFALGSKYMVVPVLDNSGKRTVRLPRGSWLTPDGDRIRGPRVMNVDVSDGRALVYTLQGK